MVRGGGISGFISMREVWIHLICSIHLTVAMVPNSPLNTVLGWVSSPHELSSVVLCLNKLYGLFFFKGNISAW